MKKASMLVPGIILTIAGLLVLLVPGKVITIVTAAIAAFILVQGIRNLYITVNLFGDIRGALRTSAIVKNTVNIIFSAVVIVMAFMKPHLIMSVLVYVIAADLLVSAGIDAIEVISLHRMGSDSVSWFDVLWHLVLAVLLFLFPRVFASAALTVVAVVMLVMGIVLIAASAFTWYHTRKLERILMGDVEPGCEPRGKSHQKGTLDDPIDVEWTESDR